MSAEPTALTEFEHDALVEVINIAVSHAAVSLRDMVGEEVHLSVPNLALVSRARAIELLGGQGARPLVAVHQQFDGEINGRALLIFPEAKSLELVRAIAGEAVSVDDIAELEHEALAETGNIILNSCLGTIANLLERNLRLSLPQVVRGAGAELIGTSADCVEEVVMFLHIDFSVLGRDLHGYIALLMDLPALAALRILLQDFIQRATGGLADADG